MAKVPGYERVLEVLRHRGEPASEDWAWIEHYLALADKCLGLDEKAAGEGRSEKIAADKMKKQRPVTEMPRAVENNPEAAEAESSPPQAKKQSA